MTYVVNNPSAARAVGSRAARCVQEILSPELIGRTISDRFARLGFERRNFPPSSGTCPERGGPGFPCANTRIAKRNQFIGPGG